MTAAPLRGNIEGTFAYLTVRDRWPKIMAKIVDHLTRVRESIIERLGEEGKEDVGRVIEHLSEIRYRMMTDKPLTDFEDSLTDVSVWNDCLKKLRDRDGADNVTWFKAEWLFVECYLYRKVAEFFSLTKHLKDYDCFAAQKKDSFVDCLSPIAKIVKYLNDTTGSHDKAEDEEKVRASLHELIEVCLWGNVCDLSLSGGDNHSANESPIELISLVRRKILANDIDKVVEYLVNSRGSGEVHIVVDNASIELVGDLALGDFIRQRNLAKKIVFHGKARPWFVSDATKNDFTWTIDVLVKSEDDELRQLGNRLTNALELKTMEIRFHPFWTYGFPYESMASVSPDLYAELQTSKLTILKGDLNYRKLVGDKDWKYDEPLLKALNGFLPSPLLALRTLKAETVAGLPEDSVKCIEKKYGPSKNWMVTGEYAVAQFIAAERMAMDVHFDADNLKFCSPVINIQEFLDEAFESQRTMEVNLGLVQLQKFDPDAPGPSEESPNVRAQFIEFLKERNREADVDEAVRVGEQVIERIDRGTEQMFNSTPLTEYAFTGYIHDSELQTHKKQAERRKYIDDLKKQYLHSHCRRRLKYAFYLPSELEREYCLGKRTIKDVVITCHIMQPCNKWHVKGERGRPIKPEFKFILRGETTLHELRDKFVCSADFCTMVPDYEDATDSSVYHVEQYPSNFLFIHDTFYVDTRKTNAQDISKEIREFMARNHGEFGPTKMVDMEGVLIRDLTLRLGFPYNYTHQGLCEHLFQFTDLRLMNAQDEERLVDFPIKVFDQSKVPKCAACKMNSPAFVVQNSDRLSETLMLMCNVCFRTFHYENDKRVGSFNAYHYFCPQ